MRVLARTTFGECWLWQGCHNSGGYGLLVVDGQPRGVHRIVWEGLIGPIPDGLEIDHMCRVRDCVNPDHLRTVTHAINVGSSKRRRLCGKGLHRMAGHNVLNTPSTGRRCRACKAESDKDRKR